MSFQKIAVITSLVIIIGGVILFIGISPKQESFTKGTTPPIFPPPAVAPFPSSPSSEQRSALVIGNSAYAGDNFLTNPVNDAKALAAVLRQLQFDVIHQTNLNRKQMKAAVHQFSQQLAKKPGVGLFYYSGHGLQYQGVNYLIPIGANQALKAVYDLPDETVTMTYVLSAMKTVENKVNLLILDACRNPPRFVKSWYKGDMIPPGLALPQRTPDASLIAYAAAPGQVALSGEGQANSPYVKSLMKWMLVPNLSVTDALIQVRNEVINATHKMQQPEFSVALNKPFYFNWDADRERKRKAEQTRLARELEAKQTHLDAKAKAQAQAEARLAQEREAFKQQQAKWQAEQQPVAGQQPAVPPSDETAPKPVPSEYRLTVLATPADSQIKIMNIKPRYVPGIALEPGDYEVLVNQAGYIASRQWITIQDQDVTVPVVLEQKSTQFFRDRLQDGSQGPEMVRIAAGSFRMGDLQGEGSSDEKPVHSVSVARFAMGRYEVTVGEFRRFVTATRYKTDAEKENGCYVNKDGSWNYVKDANWHKPYFSQNDNHPVVCVSWNDATAYAAWLSQQTGQTYRLPTEAEWEYAARAGTKTSRYWGNNPDQACRYANVHDNTSKQKNQGFSWTHHKCTDGYAQTAPVGSFKPNAFNLFDILGNVWEWTCSEYEDNYTGKESKCISQKSGSLRALRGGAWNDRPRSVRTASRDRGSHGNRGSNVGLRLARLF
ncbi:MAG: hypothetical protein DRR19_03980 [Candidatus Parabeggiatoa sp. nov. 1]|nr:MAG: hypothetical protein DRR19_03980 [Gammaproteobacteria bacterium]